MRTVRMLLCASEEARQDLWLLATVYTLLVNQLSQEVSAHANFQRWQTQGFLPQKAIQAICNKLKKAEEFSGLPARIYTSAVLMVSNGSYPGGLKVVGTRRVDIVKFGRY